MTDPRSVEPLTPSSGGPLPLVEGVEDMNAIAAVLAVFVIDQLQRKIDHCPWCKVVQKKGEYGAGETTHGDLCEGKHHHPECPAVRLVDMCGRNLWDKL